jgi:hypothetical protein
MGDTLTQSRKLSSTDKLEVKQTVTRALFFGQVLEMAAIEVGHTFPFESPISAATLVMRNDLEKWADVLTQAVGSDTEAWLEKKFDNPAFKQTLPHLITTVSKLKGETSEMLYNEVSQLLHKLVSFKGRAMKLNFEKYKLLLQFISQEMDAELSGGETSLTVNEGELIFKIRQPESKFKEEGTV